jgi:hypothetical protein
MRQAHHALAGQIRLLGTRAAATAASASAAAAPPALLTLPNGKQLEVGAQDISFTMPAEWAPHAGTWMAWPKRPDVWRAGAAPARKAFLDVIAAISQFEPVTIIADPTVVGPWGRGGRRRSASGGAGCSMRAQFV